MSCLFQASSSIYYMYISLLVQRKYALFSWRMNDTFRTYQHGWWLGRLDKAMVSSTWNNIQLIMLVTQLFLLQQVHLIFSITIWGIPQIVDCPFYSLNWIFSLTISVIHLVLPILEPNKKDFVLHSLCLLLVLLLNCCILTYGALFTQRYQQ